MANNTHGSRQSEFRTESLSALNWMIERIQSCRESEPPSAESILCFVRNLLSCRGSISLQGLAVRAAFQVILRDSERIRKVMVANDHPSTDVIQVECDDPDRGGTIYRHAPGAVTIQAIEKAVTSVAGSSERTSHVIFITTDPITPVVQEHSAGVYQRTGGIEFAILDCIGFLRHFLHLFHRHRAAFLDAYQTLVLAEPDSSVRFELKQAFLALRQAAMTMPETDE